MSEVKHSIRLILGLSPSLSFRLDFNLFSRLDLSLILRSHEDFRPVARHDTKWVGAKWLPGVEIFFQGGEVYKNVLSKWQLEIFLGGIALLGNKLGSHPQPRFRRETGGRKRYGDKS